MIFILFILLKRYHFPCFKVVPQLVVKVSPFGGEYVGGAMGGKDAVLRRGGEPILVGGLTYIGRHRDLYSFVVGAI